MRILRVLLEREDANAASDLASLGLPYVLGEGLLVCLSGRILVCVVFVIG